MESSMYRGDVRAAGPVLLPRGPPLPRGPGPPGGRDRRGPTDGPGSRGPGGHGRGSGDHDFRPGPLTRILPSMANKAAGKAKKDGADGPPGRIKQIRMVAGIIREKNPRALPIIALSAAGVIAVFVIVGQLTGLLGLLIPLGVLAGLATAMIMFGRFAQSA